MAHEDDSGPEHDTYPPAYVAKLVHELRTPLTALRGSLGLLASVVDEASPEVKNFAAIAERNASRLAGMLDDLAELERFRSGGIAAGHESADIQDVVDAAVFGAQALAEQAGVSVDASVDAGVIATDGALFKNLLSRILSYAIRMSGPSTPVRVRARREDGLTVLEVSDSGKRTDIADGHEVFDPFSLAARRGQDPSARPGLGLAIARAIAELIGATLTFTMTEGGGVFRIGIPGEPRIGSRDPGLGTPDHTSG
ncbi:MAG: HAMP domain-containing sensor histidine kinase [Acidobacteriota bacterium]